MFAVPRPMVNTGCLSVLEVCGNWADETAECVDKICCRRVKTAGLVQETDQNSKKRGTCEEKVVAYVREEVATDLAHTVTHSFQTQL
jgi:hypothetical protein